MMEEQKEKKRGGQREICCGSEGDRDDCQSMIVQEKKECGGEGNSVRDRPGSVVVEECDGGTRQSEKDGE